MSLPLPRLTVPLGLALFAVGLVVGARPGLLVDLDLRAHDAFARQTPAPAADPRVAIVAVDEPSLAAHGQWPWPRDVLARLVRRLAEAGAAAIAFDVLFSEPDRLGQAAPGALPATDRAFAEAIAGAPVAAGFALTFDARLPGAGPTTCALHPLEPVRRDRASAPLRLFTGTGAVCSVDALARAATASGAINASPDADGVLRRLPVFVVLNGRTYPALALAAVHLAAPGPLLLEAAADGTQRLHLGGRTVTLDGAGQARLRFRGAGRTYPHLSATAVIDGSVGADALAGRVVFVGATALGVRDVAVTPLDPRFPGVELHATLADILLGGAASAPPPFAGAVDLLLAYLATVAGVTLVWTLGTAAGGGAALAAGAATWFGARALYGATGTIVSPVGPAAALVIGAVVTVAAQLAAERRRADLEHRRRDQAHKLIVQTLTTLTETRDVDTGRHARRTQEYVRLLARSLATHPDYRRALPPERVELLATLAPLHDIGKVGISDAVLNKPGHLTPAEYAEMKRHATLGHDSLLKAEHLAGVHDNEVLAVAKEIVYTHHERWDGSGYPRGLRGTAIPLAGRLVAVVDTFDALVEARAYKAALPPDRAREIIMAGRGTHFDPDVVDAFLRCFEQFRQIRQSAAMSAGRPGSGVRSPSTPASPPPDGPAPASSPRRD
ncbi:MAG: CHASE2 domain-containing protein [Vicinamibacterales bacterium]